MVNWVSTIVTCAGYALIARFVHVYAHARRNKVGNSQLDFSELTVLVPFRNEENRIQTLLASLNEQAKLPMVYFIDDHSTDATRKVIADTATFAHTVLTSSKEGKKAAINEGMDHVTTSHVLTLDSDVALPMGYFEEVLKLGEADVSILPVEMKGEGIVAGFFRWEYHDKSLH